MADLPDGMTNMSSPRHTHDRTKPETATTYRWTTVASTEHVNLKKSNSLHLNMYLHLEDG